MHASQCLERQLAMLLAAVYGPGPRRQTRKEFVNLLDQRFRATFGQLLRTPEAGGLGSDEVAQLTAAVAKRNWLAHDYLWERAVDFMTPLGRARMIHELLEAEDQFDALDSVLTNATSKWMTSHGISSADVDAEMDRLVQEASSA